MGDPLADQVARDKQRADLVHRFRHHPPTGEKVARHEGIRENLLGMALYIANNTRPSREQSLALTHLEEAMFWANAAIARETT